MNEHSNAASKGSSELTCVNPNAKHHRWMDWHDEENGLTAEDIEGELDWVKCYGGEGSWGLEFVVEFMKCCINESVQMAALITWALRWLEGSTHLRWKNRWNA